MAKKNNQKLWVAMLLGLAVIGGIWYAFIGGGYGVFVSCEQHQILDLKKFLLNRWQLLEKR